MNEVVDAPADNQHGSGGGESQGDYMLHQPNGELINSDQPSVQPHNLFNANSAGPASESIGDITANVPGIHQIMEEEEHE